MMRNARRVALGLVLLAVAPACQGTTVRDLWNLSMAINGRFNSPATVGLSNSSELNITFKDFNEATVPAADRDDFAHRVALFAYASYPKRDSLKVIQVELATAVATTLPGIKLSISPGKSSWTIAELKAEADSSKSR